jgi:hypothetical protein
MHSMSSRQQLHERPALSAFPASASPSTGRKESSTHQVPACSMARCSSRLLAKGASSVRKSRTGDCSMTGRSDVMPLLGGKAKGGGRNGQYTDAVCSFSPCSYRMGMCHISTVMERCDQSVPVSNSSLSLQHAARRNATRFSDPR